MRAEDAGGQRAGRAWCAEPPSLSPEAASPRGTLGAGVDFAVPLLGPLQTPVLPLLEGDRVRVPGQLQGDPIGDFEERSCPPARRDLPKPPPVLPGSAPKASLAEALAIARSAAQLSRARDALVCDFYANSARISVSRKRAGVCDLAEAVAASEGLTAGFPLCVQVITGVAASLKGARFRSAGNYLAELRLHHIELGYPMDTTLARAFDQSKRSAERGLGPKVKAAELRYTDLRWDAQHVGPAAGGAALQDPWACWVIAFRFLLRELEVANVKLAHVTFQAPDRCMLKLPVSKMDCQGTGAAVTLCCTCDSAPWGLACPVHVLRAQVVLRRAQAGTSVGDVAEHDVPLFPTCSGAVPTKAAVVAAWQSLVKPGVSIAVGGHSARRSGAKFYARALWPLLSIQLVGRWAGATVLEYVEEALKERALQPDGAPVAAPATARERPMAAHRLPRRHCSRWRPAWLRWRRP